MFDRAIYDIIIASCNIIYYATLLYLYKTVVRALITYSTVTDLAKLRG
jgi:hypothetical protein